MKRILISMILSVCAFATLLTSPGWTRVFMGPRDPGTDSVRIVRSSTGSPGAGEPLPVPFPVTGQDGRTDRGGSSPMSPSTTPSRSEGLELDLSDRPQIPGTGSGAGLQGLAGSGNLEGGPGTIGVAPGSSDREAPQSNSYDLEVLNPVSLDRLAPDTGSHDEDRSLAPGVEAPVGPDSLGGSDALDGSDAGGGSDALDGSDAGGGSDALDGLDSLARFDPQDGLSSLAGLSSLGGLDAPIDPGSTLDLSALDSNATVSTFESDDPASADVETAPADAIEIGDPLDLPEADPTLSIRIETNPGRGLVHLELEGGTRDSCLWYLVDGSADELDWIEREGTRATLYARTTGTYLIRVLCEDETTGGFRYAEQTLSIEPAPPIADAGNDRIVSGSESQRIELDGIQSFDPEGETVALEWSYAFGPLDSVPLTVEGTRATIQVEPEWPDGEYTFQLTATTPWGTDQDRVSIRVERSGISSTDSPDTTTGETLVPDPGFDHLITSMPAGSRIPFWIAGAVQSDGSRLEAPDVELEWTQIGGPPAPPADPFADDLEVWFREPATYRYRLALHRSTGLDPAPRDVYVTIVPQQDADVESRIELEIRCAKIDRSWSDLTISSLHLPAGNPTGLDSVAGDPVILIRTLDGLPIEFMARESRVFRLNRSRLVDPRIQVNAIQVNAIQVNAIQVNAIQVIVIQGGYAERRIVTLEPAIVDGLLFARSSGARASR